MYLATGLRPDQVTKLEHFLGLVAMKQAALWRVGMGDGRRNSWGIGNGKEKGRAGKEGTIGERERRGLGREDGCVSWCVRLSRL